MAREYERKKIVDLLYPLLLMYRRVLYEKLDMKLDSSVNEMVSKKAQSLPLDRIINALHLLNNSINALEQNPNRLLLLFSIFTQLP